MEPTSLAFGLEYFEGAGSSPGVHLLFLANSPPISEQVTVPSGAAAAPSPCHLAANLTHRPSTAMAGDPVPATTSADLTAALEAMRQGFGAQAHQIQTQGTEFHQEFHQFRQDLH